MADFSITQAAGAGFSLITRKPLAILGWAVLILVVGLAPAGLILGSMIPDVLALRREAQIGAQPAPTDVMQLYGRFMMLYPLLGLGMLALRAVLTAAAFRAVLEPHKGGWAYLRFGAQELWLLLLILAFGILAGVAAVIAALGAGAVIGVAALIASQLDGVGWLVPVVACIAVAAAVWVWIWLMLRLSLAFPMTFAEREFRLFESWAVTRGHALKLFWMVLLLILLVLAVGIVIDLVVALVVFSAIGLSFTDAGRLEAFFERPPEQWMAVLAPWVAVWAVLASVFGAAFTAILAAPWAEVYRQLTGSGAAGAEPVPPEPPADEASEQPA